MRKFVFALLFWVSACVSYNEEYEVQRYGNYGEYTYNSSSYGEQGYSYYNSPLRIRGLTYNDFYMLDNHPSEYFEHSLWSGLADVNRFVIHSFFRSLVR